MVSPAAAVGYHPLDTEILSNPFPGWQRESAPALSSISDELSSLEQAAVGPEGGREVVAVEGWANPSANADLVVVLVAIEGRNGSALESNLDQNVISATNPAVLSVCSAAGTSPDFNMPVIGVPNSHMAECSAPDTGHTVLAAAWSKANVLAIVTARESGPNDETLAPALASFVSNQNAAMSASDISVPNMQSSPAVVSSPGASSPVRWPIIAVGAVIFLAMVFGIGIALGLSRRRTPPSSFPPPPYFEPTPTVPPPPYFETGQPRPVDGEIDPG
jgi:hypothetical protein